MQLRKIRHQSGSMAAPARAPREQRAARTAASRPSKVNRVFLWWATATATTTLENNARCALDRSWWPSVMGSNVPGKTTAVAAVGHAGSSQNRFNNPCVRLSGRSAHQKMRMHCTRFEVPGCTVHPQWLQQRVGPPGWCRRGTHALRLRAHGRRRRARGRARVRQTAGPGTRSPGSGAQPGASTPIRLRATRSRQSPPTALGFFSSWATEAASCSTRVTAAAPREAASNPSAPVPANTSRRRQHRQGPGRAGVNGVSRTRSGVGRKPGLSATGSLVRFHCPPMMRTACAAPRCATTA